MYPLIFTAFEFFTTPGEPYANGKLHFERYSGTRFIRETASAVFYPEADVPFANLKYLALLMAFVLVIQFVAGGFKWWKLVLYTAIILFCTTAIILYTIISKDLPVSINLAYYIFMAFQAVLIVINFIKKNEPLKEPKPEITE